MDQLETSVVRIWSQEESVVGAGFLVMGGRVLTCAHVVADALGISSGEERPPTGVVSLDLPFVAAGTMIAAKVVVWYPESQSTAPVRDGLEDIAILALEGQLPPGARPAGLVDAGDSWGHTFRAYGFPAAHDRGVWARGTVLGALSGGWVQIEDEKSQGYFIAPGFSGAPVWDDHEEGVVGMVVAADRRSEVRAAFAVPASTLIQAWPELGEQAIDVNPYRGLFAFREQDAPFFFGRTRFVDSLAEEIEHRPLVAVIGSSGSGKSSAVMAGLLPRLRSQESWIIACMRPENTPLENAGRALIPYLEPDMSEVDRMGEVEKLTAQLQNGGPLLPTVVRRILEKHGGDKRLLLVVDQFEELYTLCTSEDEPRRFIDEMLNLVKSGGLHTPPSIVVLLTLRADFLDAALSYRPLSDALQHADLKLGPMNEQELRDAVEMPARKRHVRMEDGLTSTIVKAVGDAPGNLPLLEYALTMLWTRQHHRTLTHSAYEEIGGVENALSRRAEDVYSHLNPEEQQAARRIFVQLVQPGDGTRDSRRIATRSELGEERWELVLRLADHRLVVTGRKVDPTTKEPEETVEVAHEALIRSWERLRTWIEADREFRLWQERIRLESRQWQNKQWDDGALLRGSLLRDAERWVLSRDEDLGSLERSYIAASVALKEREMQEQRIAEGRRIEAEREYAEIEADRATIAQPDRRLLFGTLGVGTAITLAILLLSQFLSVFSRFELNAYDFLFGLRQHAPAAPHVAVVFIPSAEYDNPHWMARAIDLIDRGGASAIGVYVPYFDDTPRQYAELRASITRAHNVVLVSEIQNGITVRHPALPLSQVEAGEGVNNLPTDLDSGVRALDLQVVGPGTGSRRHEPYPAFAVELARVALGHGMSDQDIMRGLARSHMLINFAGGYDYNGGVFHDAEYDAMVAYPPARKVLQTLFQGKAVLVVRADDAPRVRTPIGLMYEGYVQANALNTLLARNPIRSPGGTLNDLVLVVLGLLATAIASRFSTTWSAPAALILVVGYGFLAALLFLTSGLWVNLVTPEVTIVLTFAAVVALRVIVSERQRRRIESVFGKYANPKIVDILVGSREDRAALATSRRAVTVLCVGLHGFTEMADRVAAEQIPATLRGYFEGLSESVHQMDGTIAGYSGDELIAVWNAPRPQDNHPALAVMSALDMIGRMERINEQLSAGGLPPIMYAIGINSGDAVTGQMGGPGREHYDVVGQTVELARRLCRSAKPGSILVGERTWQLVGDRLVVQEIQGVMDAGQGAALTVFQVLGIRPEGSALDLQAEASQIGARA